jgi:hypothetical protein
MVCARQVIEDIPPTCGIQSLFAADLFLLSRQGRFGSTGSKQTSKGLFICEILSPPEAEDRIFYLFRAPFSASGGLGDEIFLRTFCLPYSPFRDGGYAFISTSTPEGRSSLLSASTVLEEEV